MIFNLLLEAFFLLFPLAFFRKHGLNAVKELGLERKKASSACKQSLIILGAMAFASIALSFAFIALGINDISKVSEALLEAKSASLFFAFSLTIGVFLEEFFFRGFLIKYFEELFFPKFHAKKAKSAKAKLNNFFAEYSGVLASSIIFGLMHVLYGSIAEIAGAMALGAVLAFFWKKYKNLYANVYAHLLWNAIILIVGAMV